MKKLIAFGAACLVVASASGQIIFDDFNLDEGHFSLSPTFSGTSIGEHASSSADRVTTDNPFEGEGHQRLNLIHDGSATALRIRHLSGGGTPANNVPFTTTAGVDGYIGYYLRTAVAGLHTQLALDTSANTGGSMWGSSQKEIIADGQWHLYEWSLDEAIWGGVPGIVSRATGNLPNDTYTIDSIYFIDINGVPSPSGEYFLDFVALNPNGSVAALVPEPSTYALMFGSALGVIVFQRLRRKQAG